ncbi:MAG: hypothetical protein P8X76_02135, partial [Maritimibacter sp.]
MGGLKGFIFLLTGLFAGAAAHAEVTAELCTNSVLPIVDPKLAPLFQQSWRAYEAGETADPWLAGLSVISMAPVFVSFPSQENIKLNWSSAERTTRKALSRLEGQNSSLRRAYFMSQTNSAYLKVKVEAWPGSDQALVTCSLASLENPFLEDPEMTGIVKRAEQSTENGDWVLDPRLSQIENSVIASSLMKEGGQIINFVDGPWRNELVPKPNAST